MEGVAVVRLVSSCSLELVVKRSEEFTFRNRAGLTGGGEDAVGEEGAGEGLLDLFRSSSSSSSSSASSLSETSEEEDEE